MNDRITPLNDDKRKALNETYAALDALEWVPMDFTKMPHNIHCSYDRSEKVEDYAAAAEKAFSALDIVSQWEEKEDSQQSTYRTYSFVIGGAAYDVAFDEDGEGVIQPV